MKTSTIRKSQVDEVVLKKPHLDSPLKNEEFLIDNQTVSVCRITTQNTIKFCNADFITTSGYTEKELLHHSLDLIKHPEMPKVITNIISKSLENEVSISSIIKNRAKDGSYFWTLSNYKPNEGNNLTVAYAITSRPISENAKHKIEKLYSCLYKIESHVNEDIAEKYLMGFLEERCMTFSEYINYLVSL